MYRHASLAPKRGSQEAWWPETHFSHFPNGTLEHGNAQVPTDGTWASLGLGQARIRGRFPGETKNWALNLKFQKIGATDKQICVLCGEVGLCWLPLKFLCKPGACVFEGALRSVGELCSHLPLVGHGECAKKTLPCKCSPFEQLTKKCYREGGSL